MVLPFKRWEIAARALNGTGIRLRIAGPQPDPDYAARVRAAGDSVELLGEVDDATLRSLYAESDLLLHPSAVEVLSATVLQALAAGLPVLGGGAVEGVVQDGSTGWSLADQDLGRFTEGLRAHALELCRNDAARRTMGDAARADALERYSWSRVVESHLPVYRAVASA